MRQTVSARRGARLALGCVIIGFVVPNGSAVVLSAPPPAEITYKLDVGTPRRVCAGSEVEVRVALQRNISQPLPWGGSLTSMDAVPVTAHVADSDIVGPPESVQVTGWDNSLPAETWFTFTAKKAGLTTITFTANIAGMRELAGGIAWPGVLTVVPVDRPVRVVNCRYRVLVVSTWDFPESNLAVSSAFEGAELRFGEEGNSSATAVVNWGSGSYSSGSCSFKETIGPTTATLSGEMDESGMVRIKITWADATAKNVATCPDAGSSGSVALTAGPITLEMEPGARFRNSSTAQPLRSTGGSRDGWADFEIAAIMEQP
jgi:hypothetical protein